MIKKTLIFVFFVFSIGNAQIIEDAPWMKNLKESKKDSKLTLKDISAAFDNYMLDKDRDKKGSGHKPFKRWEYRWSHSLLKDGTIAPASYLWDAWKKKNELSQKSTISKSSVNSNNWTSVGPFKDERAKGQGRINMFIVDPNNPNTYYVGAPSGGLWKSTDSGTNWVPLTDNLPQIGVSGIAIDPNDSNTIYITTGDDDADDTYSVGVMKSIDGGISWNFTGLTSPSSMNEIYIDPTNSNIIWAASNSGLYKSVDAGLNWSVKQFGNIRDFKLKPGDPNTIYACTSSNFYKSVNGGDSFTKITDGLPTSSSRLTIDISPANPNYVYVLSANLDQTFQGVYISINSGTTFSKTIESDDIFGSSQAWFDFALGVSNVDENLLFVGVLNIQRSTDGGNNFIKINDWFQHNEPSFTHADIHFLRYYDINGVSTLFAGTDGGIYKSIDDGDTFTDISETLSISQFYKISVSKQNAGNIVGGLQDNGGFGFSNTTWKNYHGGDGMDNAIDPSNRNKYYGFTQYGGSLNTSSNGGELGNYVTSAPVDETGANDSGGNWVTPLAINSQGELFAGYSKLYKLNNNVWEAVSGAVFGGNLNTIEIDPNNDDIIYASHAGNLYKSIDRGINFTIVNAFSNISSIEVNNDDSQIIYVTEGGYSQSIFKSIDQGNTFENISGTLPIEPKLIVKHQPFSPDNDIYLGTELGVYHINDTMTDWEVFSTGLPNVRITDLEINQDEEIITAATYGRGVWQSPINVTLPDNDVRLVRIDSPSSEVNCDAIFPIITVENRGLNSIATIDVVYTIDGVQKNHQWNGVLDSNGALASKETVQILLPEENLSIGAYNLDAAVAINLESRLDNNTYSSPFYINQKSTSPNVVNDFEDPRTNEWLTYNEGNESVFWGITRPQHATLNSASSGVYAYSNLPNNINYPDETRAYLTSPCYDLTTLITPVLKFNMTFLVEINWDVIYMEYSTDGGISWSILGTADDLNWYNSDRTNASSGVANDCQNCPGAQWTGGSTAFKEYSYDLTPLANEQDIIFRFVFVSDALENDEGVVIDDFVIDGTLDVPENKLNAVAVFPNPSSDIFNVQWREGNDINISLFDMTGKLILTKNNIDASSRNYQLDLTNHAQGIYVMKLMIDNRLMTKKIILK